MRRHDSIRLCPVHGGRYKGHCYRENSHYNAYSRSYSVDCYLMQWGFWRFGRREFIVRVTIAAALAMVGVALVCLGTSDPLDLHAVHYALGWSGWVMLSMAFVIPLPVTLTVKSLIVGTVSALIGAVALFAAGFWAIAIVLLAVTPVLCVPIVLNHTMAPESVRQAAMDEIVDERLKRAFPSSDQDGLALSLRAMRDETTRRNEL